MPDIKLTIWNEFRHEKQNEKVKKIYPKGMHEAIGAYFRKHAGFSVQTASLDEPEHGLAKDVLQKTDVLMWWGHLAHGEVKDQIVDRVQERVWQGMGLIVLHSGHHSKPFKRLMGTSGNLKWRETDDKEILWVTNPHHPITKGVGPYIELPAEEMYGEHFDIPEPDHLLFVSWFTGGEVFRSGATWTRGKGKIFYFRPGHETFPTYHNADILKVLENAACWARFAGSEAVDNMVCPNAAPVVGKKKA